VYLTDLTFIGDGNPDSFGELINFKKRELECRVLQEIELYQHTTYPIEPKEPLFSYLLELPFLEEDCLYNLSLKREPRNATISDLV